MTQRTKEKVRLDILATKEFILAEKEQVLAYKKEILESEEAISQIEKKLKDQPIIDELILLSDDDYKIIMPIIDEND